MKAPLPIVVALAWPMAILAASTTGAQIPDAVAAPNEAVVATVHAEGAQVYDCKAGADGKLVWQFREPIATLLIDGKTVGRHFAGPGWELADGSAVTGKIGLAPRLGSTDRRHDDPEAQYQGRRCRRIV
jgi:hypothetical protein